MTMTLKCLHTVRKKKQKKNLLLRQLPQWYIRCSPLTSVCIFVPYIFLNGTYLYLEGLVKGFFWGELTF